MDAVHGLDGGGHVEDDGPGAAAEEGLVGLAQRVVRVVGPLLVQQEEPVHVAEGLGHCDAGRGGGCFEEVSSATFSKVLTGGLVQVCVHAVHPGADGGLGLQGVPEGGRAPQRADAVHVLEAGRPVAGGGGGGLGVGGALQQAVPGQRGGVGELGEEGGQIWEIASLVR